MAVVKGFQRTKAKKGEPILTISEEQVKVFARTCPVLTGLSLQHGRRIEPKVIVPYHQKADMAPRRIEIERKTRLFATQDIDVSVTRVIRVCACMIMMDVRGGVCVCRSCCARQAWTM